MKISIKKDALLKALQKICNIIGNKTTMPILANVLIETGADGKLTMTTTDLELRISTRVEMRSSKSVVVIVSLPSAPVSMRTLARIGIVVLLPMMLQIFCNALRRASFFILIFMTEPFCCLKRLIAFLVFYNRNAKISSPKCGK